LEKDMVITDREFTVARELGEAILRFVVAIGSRPNDRRTRTPTTDSANLAPSSAAARSRLGSEKILFTVAETAGALSLARTTVYGLMETGKLPYVKIGRARRVRLDDIVKLIEANLVSRS
jgi:excisionase family DNA binding protein